MGLTWLFSPNSHSPWASAYLLTWLLGRILPIIIHHLYCRRMSVSTPNCQGIRRNQKLSSLSSSGRTNAWPQRSSTSGIASYLNSYMYNIEDLNIRYSYWLYAIASCTCCLLKLNLFKDWVMVHEYVQCYVRRKYSISLILNLSNTCNCT